MSAIDSLSDADVAFLRSRVEELQREVYRLRAELEAMEEIHDADVYRLRLGLDAAKKSHVTVDTSRQRDLPFEPPIPPGRGEAASNPIEQAALALYAADDEAAEATRRFDCAEYAPGEVGSFSLYETYLSACARRSDAVDAMIAAIRAARPR